MLCKYKGVEIVEGVVCADYVHLCVCMPPKTDVSSFMRYRYELKIMPYISAVGVCCSLVERLRPFWVLIYQNLTIWILQENFIMQDILKVGDTVFTKFGMYAKTSE